MLCGFSDTLCLLVLRLVTHGDHHAHLFRMCALECDLQVLLLARHGLPPRAISQTCLWLSKKGLKELPVCVGVWVWVGAGTFGGQKRAGIGSPEARGCELLNVSFSF